MKKYTYYVKVGDKWSDGEGELTADFDKAFPFHDDDKELAYYIKLGFFSDVEHWCQRHALQWPGSVVVRVDENGNLEEECLN